MDDSDADAEIEHLARAVARAHGARWLAIIFAPESEAPWSVSIDAGHGTDAANVHRATLAEALRARLTL